ncbi:hypothetical protein [Arthrobacter alpinus]|uniref:hypothetical protein n=1 Tax=Arthrobacter alpinus TaxID=656366 RepID=UPI0012FEBA20|nr:hypothetical protein [Arthrobacter alpinus]
MNTQTAKATTTSVISGAAPEPGGTTTPLPRPARASSLIPAADSPDSQGVKVAAAITGREEAVASGHLAEVDRASGHAAEAESAKATSAARSSRS